MDQSVTNLINLLPTYNYRTKIVVTIMNMLSFYKTNPRSIYQDKPYYKHPEGISYSPIGRFILDDKYDPEIENKFMGQFKDILHSAILPLVEEGDFYPIEQLHNFNEYWNNNQLSQLGLNYIGFKFGFNTNELYSILSVYTKN